MSATPLTPPERSAQEPLRIVELTGSTNDDARELALDGAPSGFAIAARNQSAARGRRGHQWVNHGPALGISVVLRPKVPMSFFSALSAVASLGVLRALRQLTGLDTRLGLKWPNDVVAFGEGFEAGTTDGRKLGGMLVEAGHDGSGAFAIAGQGINLWATSAPGAQDMLGFDGAVIPAPVPASASVDAAPSFAPLEAVSLEELVGSQQVPGFELLAERLRQEMILAVGEWEARSRAQGKALSAPLAPMLAEYQDSLAALGHRVTAYSPQGIPVVRGVFAGVDGWGRARLLSDEGRELNLASEQVSLRVIN